MTGSAVRVLIADDDPLACEALRLHLLESGMDVVALAFDGHQTLAMAEDLLPDVVLLDLLMPDMNGLEVLSSLVDAHPEMRILIISAHSSPVHVAGALVRGASGFLTKQNLRMAQLPEMIRRLQVGRESIVDGESIRATLFPSMVKLQLQARFHELRTGTLQSLTVREFGVLRLIARRYIDDDIAKELVLTAEHVQEHIAGILKKLRLDDREQLFALVGELGNVEEELPGVGS
jgi:DNA-binding NarL/FixJ family response regulator